MPPIVIDAANLTPEQGFVIQGDATHDLSGHSVSNAGDVNGDGIDDFVIGTRPSQTAAGKAYVIFGEAGAGRTSFDLTTLAADDGFVIQGSTYVRVGFSVSSAGDINGDGFDDLIIGAPYSYAGTAYIVYGKSGATRANVNLDAMTAAEGFSITGDDRADRAGLSVSNAGDINGDGIDDLIVGAPLNDDGGYNAGAAYVIFGKPGATRANFDLTSLAASDGFKIQGDEGGDRAGWSVSNAGDVNGDNIDDLIVGATFVDSEGAAYVIFGKTGATRANIDLSALASSDGFRIQGDALIDKAGWSVSSVGDINGDGLDDMIVGAPYGDDGGYRAGEAYVIFGKTGPTRTNIDLSALGPSDGFIIQGHAANDLSSWSVSGAGDIDGDGIDDLIIGAIGGDHGGNYVGEAYVIFGKAGAARANIDLTNLTERDGLIIEGDAPFGFAGNSVSNAGDINGDGIDDLIIGASYGDGGVNVVDNSGETYVIYGNTAYTSPAGTLNGTAVADILNGTQSVDSIFGLDGNDTIYTGAGNDTLDGGLGDDYLDGGAGTNSLFGGSGDDRMVVGANGSGTSVDGGADSDTLVVSGAVTLGTLAGLEAIELVGGATLTLSAAQFNTGFYNPIAQVGMANVSGTGSLVFNLDPNPITATLYLTSLSFAVGSTVSVTINGTSGLDAIKGAPGVSNTINGGDEADQIRGGSRADTIDGGNGNDKLFGWSGSDTLTGGAGSDQFRYFFATDSGLSAAADRITDFQIGVDKFNFVIIDADPITPDDQAFAFIGTGAFTSPGTGQIRYQDSGADLLVQVDVDGNGTVDMEVVLQGLAGQVLTGSDFML